MRKYRYAALAAAGVMVLATPAGAALASTHKSAPKPVLTVGKVTGAAVKKGAKISAGLAKGHKVNLKIGSFSATCSKASFTAKVVKNPASAGKATLSVIGETLGGCKLSGVPASVAALKSIKPINLPYLGSITTKNKLAIGETKKSRPMGFAAVVAVGTRTDTCVFTAVSASGKTSNKGNTVTFTNQTFKYNKALTPPASQGTCGFVGSQPSKFSAVFGPVRDISVKHHPRVFVR